jgi:hypothetical protein
MLQRFTKLIIWSGTLTAIILLAAWPSGVGADESSIPPETRWTPTPPARGSFDSRQLAEFLLTKGMISPQDMAALERSTEQSRVNELKKWSEKPPSSSHPIDSHQLADLLLTKGMISTQEMAALERGETASQGRPMSSHALAPGVSR